MTIAQSLAECFSCLCWNVLLEDAFPGEQPLYFCQTNSVDSQKTLLMFHERGTGKAMRPSSPDVLTTPSGPLY